MISKKSSTMPLQEKPKPKLKKLSTNRCYLLCWTKILASLTFLLISCGPSSCNALQERFIQIPALNRVAHLGYLYNEKAAAIIPVGVFRRNIPFEFITQIQIPSRRSYTEIPDSLIDQFNFFNIDKNTAVNILVGITKPKGAFSILQHSPQQMTGILLQEFETAVQDLEMLQDGLKENYNKEIMGHIEATHVVTSITWGCRVAVQVQLQPNSKDNNDSQVSRNLLRAKLRSLRGKAISSDSDQIDSNFSMAVKSDILLPNEIPTTGQEVKELLGQVPTLIGELNEGKGIPLSYTLTPINLIRKHLGIYQQNTSAHKLNDFTLNEIIEVFQELQSAEIQLHQLNDRIQSYFHSNCFPQETKNKLQDFQTKFRNFKSNFAATVKKSVIMVRSGLSENTILSDLVVEFSESDFGTQNFRREVADFDRDIEKIEFCRNFQTKFPSVKYFGAAGPEPEGQDGDLLNSLIELEFNSQNPILILFTKFEFVQNDPAKYTQSAGILLGKRNATTSTNSAVFVDCNFSYHFCENVTETSVFLYQNGSLSADLKINATDNVPTCSNKEVCLNGGTCIEKGSKITCECAVGFIGDNCEDIECALPGTCNSVVAKPPSCKCGPGYVKDARDPAKCQLSSNNATLLFGDAAGIQQYSISQLNTTRLISETSMDRALDYHYRTRRMFWSASGGKIYSAPIFAGASKTLLFTDTGSSILSLAIDWVHNNIYCIDDSRDKIFVVKLDGSMKKILINDGLTHPTGIVVNPLTGWMYWADHSTKKIERAGMDGTRRQVISTHLNNLYGLTLDYTENRLYWTTWNPHPCSVYSMKPDGSDQKLVLQAASPTFSASYFGAIAIFQDYVFWRDHSTNKMYRANKCDGAELTELISTTNSYFAVQVYHFSKQPDAANQCANRIRQCSHLCLPTPVTGNGSLSTTCACPDGRTLSSDGHNCS